MISSRRSVCHISGQRRSSDNGRWHWWDTQALALLAAAHFECGHYDKAVRELTRAFELTHADRKRRGLQAKLTAYRQAAQTRTEAPTLPE